MVGVSFGGSWLALAAGRRWAIDHPTAGNLRNHPACERSCLSQNAARSDSIGEEGRRFHPEVLISYSRFPGEPRMRLLAPHCTW